MKKIFIVFAFILCFTPSYISNAEESNSASNELWTYGDRDDDGFYTTGTVIYQNEVSGKLYGHRYMIEGEGLYVETNKDKSVFILKTKTNAVVTQYTALPDDPNNWILDTNKIYLDKDNPCMIQPIVSLTSSLPIFCWDDENYEESLKKYLENGDCSGATNAEEINEKYTDKYDDSIPLPQNLKVVSGVDQTLSGTSLEKLGAFNKDIVLTWEQPEMPDGMQFEIEAEFSAKRLADDNYTDLKEHTGAYHTVVQKTAYGDTKTITVSVDHKTLNGLKEKGYITKVNFRVRNIVENRTSDWVLVTIDIDKKTATANEQGYDDNSDVGGDNYNQTNVDASDNNKNVVDSSNINFTSLSRFIKDGFGLIGSGGILTLMSRTFVFLPGTFWTIIYFFVSMLVFVCVIKLIKDVIF